MAKRKTAKKIPAKKGTRGSQATQSVAAVRRQIERIDREIVNKINERATLAQRVGQLKRNAGESIYKQQVILRAQQMNRGPLADECIQAVFRELISGSRAIETSIRVAYLGPEYSYSHLAAVHRFGQSVDLVPVTNIAAVFEEVHLGQADFGLVPLENSTDGRINDTLEMFSRMSVQICGEVPLRIHHHLLGKGPRNELQEVFSKPQALSQCRNWIAKHLPDVRTVEVASTSEAALQARAIEGGAAIASLQAGINCRLEVMARNIEDNRDNITRFAVISDRAADRTGDDKSSLMFELEDRPGALADATTIFKRNRLNMTWIESFPISGFAGRYLFFVEFVGHQNDLRARRAITSLGKKAVRLDVLGSYARMDPIDDNPET